MKIGILTFHYSINQGSVLQAYCVYNLLKQKFPKARVEVIDLIPRNRELSEWNFVGKKPPFFKIHAIRHYKSIRSFVLNRIPLSKRSYKRKIDEQIEFINSMGYDYIFTGSDTVWMHSEKLDGLLPSIYFLPKGIKAKKFSIAASVDPLKSDQGYHKNKIILKETLNGFYGITVRDNVTKDLLDQLGIENVQKIADPTLLYEFENDLSLKKNKSKSVQKKKVFLMITDKNVENSIKSYLEEIGEFDFILGKKFEKGDDHVIDDLNQYWETDILITDRFHRSIFAMKLSNSLVINVERFSKNPLPQSKGRDLFFDIGIPEYCLRFESGDNQFFWENLKALVNKWNEEEFNKREILLEKFISRNKLVWDSLVSKIEESSLVKH